MKLTEEQKKMVEENHNLIYWYCNTYGLNLDDNYDLLAIELCHTVMKYNPNKGSIGNYFKLRVDGLRCKEFRKTQAKKRIPMGTEYIDNVHSLGIVDEMLEQIELNEWVDGTDSDILKLKIQGYSQTEIARELGVSQSYVSKVLKHLKRCYYETN